MKKEMLERKVLSEFKGIIGNTIITNENMYYSVGYILNILNEKFDFKEQEFLDDLVSILEYMERKIETYIDYSEVESNIRFVIEESEKFEEMEFDYYGYTYWFEELNEDIKNGKYTK